MDKTIFIHQLSLRHPNASEELLELAWQLHDFQKAETYARQLSHCNRYADIAWQPIRQLYVNGDIDSLKAVNERFINTLLPFTCLDRKPLAHSVVYHVHQMLNDKETLAARQRNLAAKQGDVKKGKYAIRAQFNLSTDSKEVVREFARFVETLKASTSRIPSLATWNSTKKNSIYAA